MIEQAWPSSLERFEQRSVYGHSELLSLASCWHAKHYKGRLNDFYNPPSFGVEKDQKRCRISDSYVIGSETRRYAGECKYIDKKYLRHGLWIRELLLRVGGRE